MNYCIDLILGKAFCIFIFFHFPDSRLSVLKGFRFYFCFLTWVKTESSRNPLSESCILSTDLRFRFFFVLFFLLLLKYMSAALLALKFPCFIFLLLFIAVWNFTQNFISFDKYWLLLSEYFTVWVAFPLHLFWNRFNTNRNVDTVDA